MTKQNQKIALKLTAAIVFGGKIQKAGATIQVDAAMARNLLHRGRAERVGGDIDESEVETIDLGKMNKPDLLKLAADYDIEGHENMTVDQLREAIKAAATE